jgi:hypothetical protein
MLILAKFVAHPPAQCFRLTAGQWDAVAESLFPPGSDGLQARRSGAGRKYSEEVIVPDEKRFLLSEAVEHMKVVGNGTIEGERIEFIVDGKATVEYGKWQAVWEEYESQERKH